MKIEKFKVLLFLKKTEPDKSGLSQERLRAAPCTTKDGTRISLMADCASVEDVRTAVEAGADGVGLLLSEYLLLAGRVNGEEEQYGFYAACLRCV